MPQSTLQILTLVQQTTVEEKTQYLLRPLFVPFPVVVEERYDLAIRNLKKELDQQLKDIVFDRAHARELLWYYFNPDYRYFKFRFSFHIRKKLIDQRYAVISFSLRDQVFGMLPGFDNALFLIGSNVDKVTIKTAAEQQIARLLRQEAKRQAEDFDPTIYALAKREFVTSVRYVLRYQNARFKFEQDQFQQLFQSLLPDTDFDGAEELGKVGYNLNYRYPDELQRAYYQDEVVGQVYQLLYGRQNTPFILVGPDGVGKHTVIQEAIFRFLKENENKAGLSLPSVWHLDPNRVISGMSQVGMWEKRLESILSYIIKPNERYDFSDKVLIDNPVALLHIGKSSQNDLTLSRVFKPYLEKRQFQLILIASPEEWQMIQEKERSFADLVQVIRMQPCLPEQAARISIEFRRQLERENNCEISIQAIQQLFEIHRNFLNSKALPGTVLRNMQQLATKHRFGLVDAAQVREAFKNYSGLKERIFDTSYVLEPDEPRKWIAQNLVGQPDAVHALSDAVHTIKAKLSDRSKPYASFLFIGPTGVGKTQAAKVLCTYLMGDEKQLMRFDMNEYIDEMAAQRLIGDFYNPEGQLTGKVRYQPFGILLLDEIEKAHPKVRDLLLQLLDDGRLTDSRGRTVDFSNTIVIMTSNIGAQRVSSRAGFRTSNEDIQSIYRKEVENFFRPEFINRIEQIIVFQPLQLEHILNIAQLQINELLTRDGFVRRTTILNISKEALEWVARRGFDENMGGRALKRQIERDLTSLSANQLIQTRSDTPILFEILLEGQHLRPQIHEIFFVDTLQEDWQPPLPEERRGRRFYGQLVQALTRLNNRLEQVEPATRISFYQLENQQAPERWQFYAFKNRVADLKEKTETLMLGYSDKHFSIAPAIPFRLKNNALIARGGNTVHADRANTRDRLFQQEALREINEQYEYTNANFDSLRTEFLDQYISVALVLLAGEQLLEGTLEQVRLQLDCFVSNRGSDQIRELLQIYRNFLEDQEISFQIEVTNGVLEMEGYGLSSLLQGETGIHLFYRGNVPPLPIRLRLFKNGRQLFEQNDYRVVRIYDHTSTLTDLRTGFTNSFWITPGEFKMLIYAGLPGKARKQLSVTV